MFTYTPFTANEPHLTRLSEEIIQDSSILYGAISNAPESFSSVVDLVRRVNSYYSNLIEGSDTSPYAVESALRESVSEKPEQRKLQEESISHILVTTEVEDILKASPDTLLASPEFIKFIHKRFYDHMPSAERALKGDGITATLIPGEFRKHNVKVSQHIAPPPEEIASLMKDYAKTYEVNETLTTANIIKIAAAHHRFAYCHPFLDGNGRTARILTEAMLNKAGVKGHSLWSLSRGLARNESSYKEMLADADSYRKGALDGRGVLSQEGLNKFTAFILETALDQIHYMHSILGLDNIKKRIDVYVNNVRATDLHTAAGSLPALRPEVADVLKAMFVYGKVSRGEIRKLIGLGERSASGIIKSLIDEGISRPVSESHKSDLKLGLTPHLTINLFPDLYPEKYLTLSSIDKYSLDDKLQKLRTKRSTPTNS